LYPVYPLSGSIALDGELNETGWRGAPVGRDFLPLMSGEPAQATHFRILYNEGGLYVGVTVFVDRTDRLRATQGDGGHVWEDDSIEIFLLPEKEGKYHQFAVNSKGNRSNTKMEVKTSVGRRSYTLEMRIPFSSLGMNGAPGRPFFGNICRNTCTFGGIRYSTWAPVKYSFHETKNFAQFCFQDARAAPERIEQIGSFVNVVYAPFLLEEEKRVAAQLHEISVRVGKYRPPDKEMDQVVTQLQKKAAAVTHHFTRYKQYADYFRAQRNDGDFWDKDHSEFLEAGPCPSAFPLMADLMLTQAEEDLHAYCLLMELLTGRE